MTPPTDVPIPAPAGVVAAPTFGPTAIATPANAITMVRLLLTPFWLLMVVERGVSWSTFVLGFGIAVTDGVDGYLARRQGTTRSGAFLDPLADKIFVVGGLATLVAADVMALLPVAIIAGREVVISAYRSYVSRQGISVPARYWAKVKTVVQEFAMAFALCPATHTWGWPATSLLWAGVVLAVVTGAQYLLDGAKLQRTATP